MEQEYNVAIVDASTLKGREVKAVLGERGFPVGRLVLLEPENAASPSGGLEEEASMAQPPGRGQFEGMHIAVFTCSPAFAEQHWRTARECGCRIIDLSYGLELNPEAGLRAAILEGLWEEQDGHFGSSSRIAVGAHPAAIAIAGILRQLSRRFAMERSAITIFEPTSERGQAGVEELHRQTINLLSFQQIPREVFDAQIAFNLVSRCGPECQPGLREVQGRIGNHVRRLLEGRAPPPALRLLQAPVFYGYAFCCFAQLQEPIPTGKIEEALDQKPFSVCRDIESQPTVAEIAGANEIMLGRVEQDPALESSYWLWGTMDNIRVAALNAVEIAERWVAN